MLLDYMKTSVNDYIFELQKIEKIENTFKKYIAAHPSMIDKDVTINEEDISKIRDNIKDLYEKINDKIYDWNKKKCSFVFDLQLDSNEDSGSVEIDDDKNFEDIEKIIDEKDLDINYVPVLIQEIFCNNANKYIVKYYNNLGFKYDTRINKTFYNI
ncbi:uncharacterized protein LOC126894441 isoform X2 [Daktulosphaira vitifoliae]|uniref:uncharacterized protein LOC126894441 isoform X2 n=1 Tax=Daktulosphaira vitifoliae TaxID=58002 RepID=UPI0021AAD702|nr:uncharacterized protein LOC126894441 isoform X2 [Daktulosphaira vitifoliae]